METVCELCGEKYRVEQWGQPCPICDRYGATVSTFILYLILAAVFAWSLYGILKVVAS